MDMSRGKWTLWAQAAGRALRRLLPATAAAGAVALVMPAMAFGAGATDAGTAAARGAFGLKLQHPVAAPQAASANTLAVGSGASTGVVSPQPRVYLVFWGSQWKRDPAGVAPDLQNLFKGLAGPRDTWGTIVTQYCEGVPRGTTSCGSRGIHIGHPAVGPLAGVWFDNAKAAPRSASAGQIAGEAVNAAGHFRNVTQAPNLNAQYVIVSATRTHPDGFPGSGFCAYHSSTSSGFGNVAFTNLPYVPDLGAGGCTTLSGRLLDGIESTETHEYAETLTDFFPANGWTASSGAEIGDECENLDSRLTLSTGTFDVQGLWSNAAKACVTRG
jgi:hypothetical protein